MKILIVEDDPISRRNMTDILMSKNHTLYTAENGKIGFKSFRKHQPELVFTDIQMPEMNGLELLQAIRNEDNETIVIVNTAFGSEQYAIQALRLGANNYLPKPYRITDIMDMIEKYDQIIQNRHSISELASSYIEHHFKLEINSQLKDSHQIAENLTRLSASAFPKPEQMGIKLGLIELITNAIEHGNLEITYEEKAQNMKEGPEIFQEFYESRLRTSRSKRNVYIEFKQKRNKYTWKITDEGKGFNWKDIPDPTKPDTLETLNGRGIFLCQFHFDEVNYIGNGNTVEAVKLLKKK